MDEVKGCLKGCCLGFLGIMVIGGFGVFVTALGMTFGTPDTLSHTLWLFGIIATALVVLTCLLYKKADSAKGEAGKKHLRWAGHATAALTITTELFAFFFLLGQKDYVKVDSMPAVEWSAKSIELPHLVDGSKYVSNPDSVLSRLTVDSVNAVMARMEHELGVEGAVVAVRRMENADIFRFCQDLFDLYGIGKDDRGIVIALAVDDRQSRIHTGTSLEAYLTDAETNYLQKTYLMPYIKQDNPDEGMKMLVEATYCMLAKKDMPAVHNIEDKKAEENEDRMTKCMYFSMFSWLIMFMFWEFFARDKSRVSFFSGGSSGDLSGSSYSSDSSSYSSRSSSSSSSSGYSGGRSSGGGSTCRW